MLKTAVSRTSLLAAGAVFSSLFGALWTHELPASDRADAALSVRHAVAAHPKVVRIAGEGGGTLQSTSFKGDRISIRVDASTKPDRPVDVQGTFHVTHRRPDGRLVAEFEGRADCLMAGGDVAVMTGIITEAESPGLPPQNLVGVRVGITVDDHGRRDRLGWSWMVMGFNPVSGCTSTAPFFAVSQGNFTVDSPRA